MKSTIESTLRYLYDLQFFGMKLGLDNTARLLDSLGNPHHRFPVIHVAGTNGKGSTCAILAAIFQASGYATGLYTSPHIHRFSERIKVDGQEIAEADIIRMTEMMRGKIDELKCTFFEATTAMAFQYFAERPIDIGIIETGLGGRLDATNVVDPEVSVITNIDFDHTEHLGDSIEKIAFEKAGIIKRDRPCVVGKVNESVHAVFTKIAGEKCAPLFFMDKIVVVENVKMETEGSHFDLKTNFPEQPIQFKNLFVGLSGEHQIQNAVTAVAATLLQKRFNLSEGGIRDGLKSVLWKGRLELVSREPFILLDAAHNPAGMLQLREAIDRIYSPLVRSKYLVIGMLKDKDYEKAIREIGPLFDKIYTVTPNSPRALDGKILAEIIGSGRTEFISDVQAAVRTAKLRMAKEDLLVITGSHFVLSEMTE
jgi:dihydrofolate synthase/folylpolyglutamate synthase